MRATLLLVVLFLISFIIPKIFASTHTYSTAQEIFKSKSFSLYDTPTIEISNSKTYQCLNRKVLISVNLSYQVAIWGKVYPPPIINPGNFRAKISLRYEVKVWGSMDYDSEPITKSNLYFYRDGNKYTFTGSKSWSWYQTGGTVNVGLYGYLKVIKNFAELYQLGHWHIVIGEGAGDFRMSIRILANISMSYPDKVLVKTLCMNGAEFNGYIYIDGTKYKSNSYAYIWKKISSISAPSNNFNHWESKENSIKDPYSSSTTYTTNTDDTLIAYYKTTSNKLRTFKLVISSYPKNSGTTKPLPGTYYYKEGTSVTVSEIPRNGYKFNYWELDGSYAGSNSRIKVVMNKNHLLVAHFERVGYNYYHRYKVCKITLEVHYSSSTGKILDWHSQKLMPNEFFVVLIKASIKQVTTRTRGSSKDYYNSISFSAELEVPNKAFMYLVKYDKISPIILNRTIKKNIKRTGIRSNFEEVIGVFIVKEMNINNYREFPIYLSYKWRNSYGDHGEGLIRKEVRICSAYPELKLIPRGFDRSELRIYLRWKDDGSYVYGRKYIYFFLNSTSIPRTDLDNGRTYGYTELYSFNPPFINSKYVVRSNSRAIRKLVVYYIDLSLVVLKRSNRSIRLEVCEFGYNASLKVAGANVTLIAVDKKSGKVVWSISKLTDKNGVAIFRRSQNFIEGHELPKSYELFALGYAGAINKIYGNQKFCKILLEASLTSYNS